MIRTQIYIPKIIHRQIITLAARRRVALAQVIRDFIEEGIKKEIKKHKNDLDQLTKLNITGGPKDLSDRMDDYLYGA